MLQVQSGVWHTVPKPHICARVWNAYLCQVFVLHLACWTRVACVANFISAQGNALFFSPNSSSSNFFIDTGLMGLRCDAMRCDVSRGLRELAVQEPWVVLRIVVVHTLVAAALDRRPRQETLRGEKSIWSSGSAAQKCMEH